MSDDDLTPYDDSPVVAALRAPAQPAELAGENAAVAMFHSARSASVVRRGRRLRRAGVAGVGVALALALTGGVAAAYTTGLPDPMQNALHSAIEPLGLPAPLTGPALRLKKSQRELHRAGPVVPPALRHSPAPSGRPLPRASTPVDKPSPSPQPASPQPAATRPPSPAPAPPPPSLSAAVSRHVVPVHGAVVLAGRLTRGGSGLSGRTVYAAELVPGQYWHRVGSAQTGSDGSVTVTVTLTSNVRLRLVTAGGVVSPSSSVAVVPKLSISVARSQGKRIATVTVDGARPAEPLVLLRRDGTSWTRVATTSVSAGTFTVPGPAATRVHYRVRLPATRLHAAGFADFYVAAR